MMHVDTSGTGGIQYMMILNREILLSTFTPGKTNHELGTSLFGGRGGEIPTRNLYISFLALVISAMAHLFSSSASFSQSWS